MCKQEDYLKNKIKTDPHSQRKNIDFRVMQAQGGQAVQSFGITAADYQAPDQTCSRPPKLNKSYLTMFIAGNIFTSEINIWLNPFISPCSRYWVAGENIK